MWACRGSRVQWVGTCLAVCTALGDSACSAEAPVDTAWVVGTWTKTYDEDRDPADSITFRADGKFAAYDQACKAHTNAYFVRDDLVNLLIPLENGPVALVFRPTGDKSILPFNSPRTRNVAFYVRAEKPHCQS